MREFSISPAEFGLLVSTYNLSGAPFTLLVGLVADRFDRKSFVLVNLVGFIVSTIYCGVSTSYNQLVIARLLAGAFGGALNVATYSVLPDLIPEIRRGAATGAVMSAFSLASVLGVPLGLTIATNFSWQLAFLFIGGVSIFIWILVLFYIPSLKSHIASCVKFKDLVSHYLKVGLKKEYWTAFTLSGLLGFGTFLLIPFISPYAVENVGIREDDLRFIYLVGGAFTFFSARFIGKLCDSWGTFKTFCLVACISLIPIAIYTNLGTTPLALTLIVSTCFMMTMSGRFVPVVTMATKNPLPEDTGVFMSFFNAMRSLATGLAAYVGGLFVTQSETGQLLGYNHIGYIAIALTLICFIPAWRLDKFILLRTVR